MGKRIIFNNIDPKIIKSEIYILKKMGVNLKVGINKIEVFKSVDIKNFLVIDIP